MSSYGFQVTNNANQQLIDEDSRQIQIVKTVTGLLPGALTPFSDMPATTWSPNQRTGNRHREPAMGFMERCPGVVMPGVGYSVESNIGTDDMVVFARANDPLGKGGSVAFNVLRGSAWVEWEVQTSTSGLNSKQLLMKYIGPWEKTGPSTGYYGQPGNLLSVINYQNESFGIAPEWNHGLIDQPQYQYLSQGFRNPYPNNDPYLWRDNRGGSDSGCYELEVVSHEAEDLIGYSDMAPADWVPGWFGRTKSVATSVNTNNGSYLATITLNNTTGLEIGMYPRILSTAWATANNFNPAIIPYTFWETQITAINGNQVTIRSTRPESLWQLNSGVQILWVPSISCTDVTPSGSNYKVTFSHDIQTRPTAADSLEWYPSMNVLYFARHNEKSWTPSNNKRGTPYQYYGYHPKSQGRYTGTSITLKSGNNPTSDIAVGDKLFVVSSTGVQRSGQQGVRTVTAVNSGTRTVTFNQNVNVYTNDFIIIKKNTGYTLDVKLGRLTNFEEESGTYGLQVFNEDGDLAWSSNRENFVIENIGSASNLKPGVHSITSNPGTPSRNTGFLSLEASDTANWEDYWVQVTCFDACAKYTDGDSYPYYNGAWGLAYHWNFPGGSSRSYENAENYGTENTFYNYSSTLKSATSKLGVGIGAQNIQMFNRATTIASFGGQIRVADAYIMGGSTSLILGKFI
mgnify:FL=1